MYELLDAAGATLCDPLLIILLAVMMMPSGGSSYVFSGKTDDVGFLLLKARAAARKLPCAHRRSAQGAQAFILNGGPPISYAEFFDLPARPDNITEAIWKDMSETAFDVIIGFIHDAKHQRLVMGCGRAPPGPPPALDGAHSAFHLPTPPPRSAAEIAHPQPPECNCVVVCPETTTEVGAGK